MHIEVFQKVMFRSRILIGLLLLPIALCAQNRISPLNHQLVGADAQTIRPYLTDSLVSYPDLIDKSTSVLTRILYYGNLIQYQDPSGINFTINPLINFEGGRDQANALFADTLYYTNSRGFIMEGNLGSKVTFSTTFQENQSHYNEYIANYVTATGAAVGLGRTKAYKTTSFDYAMATGQLVYRPTTNLQLWFGNGKNFIGNGYRSLLLSDNAGNYPYGKIVYSFAQNKLCYQALFASLSTGNRYSRFSTVEPSYITKGYSAFFLNWRVNPAIDLGLFESTVWNRVASGKQGPVDVLQYNPVLGINSLAQKLNGKNNSSVGLNLLVKPGRNYTVYSQLLVDGANKNGVQLGATKTGLFNQNLFLRAEVNVVSAGTYQAADSTSNYTHFNQALAHPMGSGFTEFTGTLNYRFKRLLFSVQGSATKFTSIYSSGTPPLMFPENRQTGITGTTSLIWVNPSLSFIINPVSNLQATIGAIVREAKNPLSTEKTAYLFLRLSTNINNLYFDF